MFSDDTSTYKMVKRGQFAYATNHIEEGSIGIQKLHDDSWIARCTPSLKPTIRSI